MFQFALPSMRLAKPEHGRHLTFVIDFHAPAGAFANSFVASFEEWKAKLCKPGRRNDVAGIWGYRDAKGVFVVCLFYQPQTTFTAATQEGVAHLLKVFAPCQPKLRAFTTLDVKRMEQMKPASALVEDYVRENSPPDFGEDPIINQDLIAQVEAESPEELRRGYRSIVGPVVRAIENGDFRPLLGLEDKHESSDHKTDHEHYHRQKFRRNVAVQLFAVLPSQAPAEDVVLSYCAPKQHDVRIPHLVQEVERTGFTVTLESLTRAHIRLSETGEFPAIKMPNGRRNFRDACFRIVQAFNAAVAEQQFELTPGQKMGLTPKQVQDITAKKPLLYEELEPDQLRRMHQALGSGRCARCTAPCTRFTFEGKNFCDHLCLYEYVNQRECPKCHGTKRAPMSLTCAACKVPLQYARPELLDLVKRLFAGWGCTIQSDPLQPSPTELDVEPRRKRPRK